LLHNPLHPTAMSSNFFFSQRKQPLSFLSNNGRPERALGGLGGVVAPNANANPDPDTVLGGDQIVNPDDQLI
jgi:hypothetical protein